MISHTPGPWQADPYTHSISTEGQCDVIDWPVWGSIARVEPTEQEDEDGRIWTCSGDQGANARLIAASPDLLAALQAIRAWCIPGMNWTDEVAQGLLGQADAAIAKATQVGGVR